MSQTRDAHDSRKESMPTASIVTSLSISGLNELKGGESGTARPTSPKYTSTLTAERLGVTIGASTVRRGDRWVFAAIFMIVNLHTLRHLIGVIYLGFYVAAAALSIALALSRRALRSLDDRGLAVSIWLSVAIIAAYVTLITTSASGAITGLLRFCFAMPIFLALAACTRSRSDLKSHITVMVCFYAVGALTVPLQEFTGPLAVFSDATSRAGFDRYRSLLGAVSVVAVTAGMIVPLVRFVPRLWRFAALMALCISPLLSLSKAAVPAVFFGVSVFAFAAPRRHLRSLMPIIGAAILSFVLVSNLPQLEGRLDVILRGYGVALTGTEIINYDVTTRQGIADRLGTLPLANIAALKDFGTPWVYLTGGGFGMADQTLVSVADSRAPQAHNQYVEIFTVFGPVMGAMLIAITISTLLRLRRRYRSRGHEEYNILCWIMVFFVVSAAFGGGAYFQPVSASVLWLCVFVSLCNLADDDTSCRKVVEKL
jgi:hypothetical protein